MSPTTYTADGRVIQHEDEAPPAEALAPAKGAPPAPKRARAPRAPKAQTTAPVKKAENQRRARVGKHRK